MKRFSFRSALSVLLCAVMLCSMAVVGVPGASAAGSTYEKVNLIADPGMDLRDGFVEDNALGRWNNWDASQSTTEGRGGGSCIKFTGVESSVRYNVDGELLQVGATYIFSIWARVAPADEQPAGGGTGDNILQVGVRQGSGNVYVNVAGTEWTQYTVEFIYTGGNPGLDIYNNIWQSTTGKAAVAYIDDASLIVKSDVERATVTNGRIELTGDNLDLAAFTAVYTSSIAPDEAKTLPLTVETNQLTFTPIAAVAVDQVIDLILSYKGQNLNFRYTVAADPNVPLVTARISQMTVTNGTINIVLAEKPTVAPTAGDFAFSITINGVVGSFLRRSFVYDKATGITVAFDPVSASPDGNRQVTVSVVCGGATTSGSFVVAQGSRRSYYISTTGNDNNNGLSPETPFRTIAKLNTIAFVPGDHIYFKSGDVFTGMFRPTGSGNAEAPIQVGKYGGEERPILRPDPNGVFSYAFGTTTAVTRLVNGTIWLENVEYWEIRDLELHDPSYDPKFYKTGTLEVFNAGLRVVNVDQGDLSHYVFDNLKIHGFRGPGINPGKTSGGIQFNVNSRAATPVPSCFVDVSITNCEIYECGRDGINSLSMWGYRRYQDNGAGWPSFPSAEYNANYNYYPSRNLYVANNILRDIDGDGLIVDSWNNAIVEHNLVTRCAIHLSNPFRAAVGLFNWNSDNTVFQYNECSFNGVNATRHTINGDTVEENVIVQDGQGIEIDALNQNTWVQYNYLHDNAAFMMLCTESAQYTSINSYIRYNVTENDGCNLPNTTGGMGWFLNGNCGINTQMYNNTCILGASALKNNQLYLLKYDSNQYKFYNNIFIYTGDTPVGVTNWQNSSDWQNNLFINITGLPTQDSETYPNFSMTKEEGMRLFAGGSGADAYRIKANTYDGKGVVLESMDDGMFSGEDMAGTPITAPGLGAFTHTGS